MYLSRIQIDTTNPEAIHDLSHLGAYHNWVESSFPEDHQPHSDDPRVRHLWRIDKLNNKQYLLITSPNKPDINKLSKYGIKETAQTKSYDNFIDSIKDGQLAKFRLTANPSYQTNNKVYPHVSIKYQTKWFLERTQKHGFELLTDCQDNPQMSIINRSWPILYHNHHKITLAQTTYEGILKITNAKRFKNAIKNGIGREKAYGMGMITIIPLK